MKLPTPWRRSSAVPPEQTVEGRMNDSPPPLKEDPSIDITRPRECIYKSFADHPGPCPRCGGSLQQSHQTYLVATRRGSKIADSFLIGSDFGWFCTRCPTVVIDPADVSEVLRYSLPDWDIGTKFAVAGIVNLDAAPEEKEDLPLGDDISLIRLVEFTNISRGRDRVHAARQAPGARKKKSKRKKHRR